MDDRDLDHALRSLPRADLDPLSARGLRLAAMRRLSGNAPTERGQRVARVLRWEALALTLLSVLQLLWAAARVLTLAR